MLDDGHSYHLSDTGQARICMIYCSVLLMVYPLQGLNRVQSAPRVYRAMSQILAKCQRLHRDPMASFVSADAVYFHRKIGHWVGSSVIHLGDKNVPNALMFIDKYSQVIPVMLKFNVLPLITCVALAHSQSGSYHAGANRSTYAQGCKYPQVRYCLPLLLVSFQCCFAPFYLLSLVLL